MANETVEILRSAEALAAVLPEWESLLGRSEFPVPFLHPLWHWTWWAVYGAEHELFVVVVRRFGKLIGLAPLYIARPQGHKIWGKRKLRFMGSNEVCSDYLHILSTKPDRAAVNERVFCALQDAADLWQALEWTDIPEEQAGEYCRAIRRRLALPYADVSAHTVCPYIKLPGDWDRLLRRLSPGMRKTVRNKWNRLLRKGRVELVQPASRQEANRAFDELVRLHQLRWNHSGLWGSFADPRFRQFHRLIVQRFFEKGILRLFLLRVGGNTAASLYGFVFGGRFFFYQMGVDTGRARDSMGLMVLAASIRSAIEEGLTEYDFLRGNAEYKRRWRPDYRRNLRIVGIRSGLGNGFYYQGGKLLVRGKHALKTVVPGEIWTEVRHLFHRRY